MITCVNNSLREYWYSGYFILFYARCDNLKLLLTLKGSDSNYKYLSLFFFFFLEGSHLYRASCGVFFFFFFTIANIASGDKVQV